MARLETATILTAFIVVASLFAYSLASAGVFSSLKRQEAVKAGLAYVSATLAQTSGLVGHGITDDILATGDTRWVAAAAAVTSTVDTADKKRGGGSVRLLVRTAFTTGLVAYQDRARSVDLTGQTQLRFWVKSSTSTTDGQIEIVLDEDGGCGSPEARVAVPALGADDWTLVTAAIMQSDGTVAVADAGKDAVMCIGLEVVTDLSDSGGVTIRLDQLVGTGLVTSLVFNITIARSGEPIDLTPPVDLNGDGLADAADAQGEGGHTLIVSYFDRNQLVRDMFWSVVFLGVDDGDDLLEGGERAEITVFLAGLADATPLTADEVFSLELQPSIGSVLTLRRSTPSNIDLVMILEYP